ncbi:MAG TPA: hypothetical protein VL358_11530 [Caulobacteraceae bacterium]|nr:hypothetical protein [Caulobacteraceae bacterium]
MSRSEIACARCGRLTPSDQLALWEQYEHHRVFQGPGRREEAADAATARTGVYNRVRKRCAYLTCQACFTRLQNGGSLDDMHNRKVAIYTAAVFALGVLIIVATPVVLPSLLIAFWRW